MNKDDCYACNHVKSCISPCLYLSIIHQLAGKNKALQELLPPPDITDKTYQEDYKTILIDQQHNKATTTHITIKEIREIQPALKRAVTAMLYAHLTIKEISEALDKSERTIRRICKQE